MAERKHHGISARLRKLPGQFLLALINATAILVIAAATVALVAIERVEHFAENVAATMTDAVLSKIDLPSRDVLRNIRELTAEVRVVGNAIREIRTGENRVLQTEIARLKESLTTVSMSVERLQSARSILTDAIAERFGGTIAQTLVKVRSCPSNIEANSPRPLTAESIRDRH
jgi:hypothetical protein